jgi:hypothetical protein
MLEAGPWAAGPWDAYVLNVRYRLDRQQYQIGYPERGSADSNRAAALLHRKQAGHEVSMACVELNLSWDRYKQSWVLGL